MTPGLPVSCRRSQRDMSAPSRSAGRCDIPAADVRCRRVRHQVAPRPTWAGQRLSGRGHQVATTRRPRRQPRDRECPYWAGGSPRTNWTDRRRRAPLSTRLVVAHSPSSRFCGSFAGRQVTPTRALPSDLEILHEGEGVQAIHRGPYAEEPRTLREMRTYMTEHALKPIGAHHEIYFGDPRRTAPENLRTLLRQPVVSALPSRCAATCPVN